MIRSVWKSGLDSKWLFWTLLGLAYRLYQDLLFRKFSKSVGRSIVGSDFHQPSFLSQFEGLLEKWVRLYRGRKNQSRVEI